MPKLTSPCFVAKFPSRVHKHFLNEYASAKHMLDLECRTNNYIRGINDGFFDMKNIYLKSHSIFYIW